MKVKRPGVGVICFVAKLNRSSAALPQAVLNAPGTVSIGCVVIVFTLTCFETDLVRDELSHFQAVANNLYRPQCHCLTGYQQLYLLLLPCGGTAGALKTREWKRGS